MHLKFLFISRITVLIAGMPLAIAAAQSLPGTLRWSYNTGTLLTGSAALAQDGTIYVGGPAGLYAVTNNGYTASNKWIFSAGGALRGSASIGIDGAIYFGTASGRFYALNSDGSIRWVHDFQSIGMSSAAIGLDGTVYVPAAGPFASLYALTSSGSNKWSTIIGYS